MELSTIPAIFLTVGLAMGFIVGRRKIIGFSSLSENSPDLAVLVRNMLTAVGVVAYSFHSSAVKIVIDQKNLMLASLATALLVDLYYYHVPPCTSMDGGHQQTTCQDSNIYPSLCYERTSPGKNEVYNDVAEKDEQEEQAPKNINTRMNIWYQQTTDDEETEDGGTESGSAEYQSCDVELTMPKPALFSTLDDSEDASEEEVTDKDANATAGSEAIESLEDGDVNETLATEGANETVATEGADETVATEGADETIATEDANDASDPEDKEAAASLNGSEPEPARGRSVMHLHVQDSTGYSTSPGNEARFRLVPVIDKDCVSPEPGSSLSVAGPFPSPSSNLEAQLSQCSRTHVIYAGLAALFGFTSFALSGNSLADIFSLNLSLPAGGFGTHHLLQVGLPMMVLVPLSLYQIKSSEKKKTEAPENYSLSSSGCSSSFTSYSGKSTQLSQKNQQAIGGNKNIKTIVTTAFLTSIVWCGLIAKFFWLQKEETIPSSHNSRLLFVLAVISASIITYITTRKGSDKGKAGEQSFAIA